MAIPNEFICFLMNVKFLALTGLAVGLTAWIKDHMNPSRPVKPHGFFSAYLSGALVPVGVALVSLTFVDGPLPADTVESLRLYLPIAGVCLLWVAVKTIKDSTSSRESDSSSSVETEADETTDDRDRDG